MAEITNQLISIQCVTCGWHTPWVKTKSDVFAHHQSVIDHYINSHRGIGQQSRFIYMDGDGETKHGETGKADH